MPKLARASAPATEPRFTLYQEEWRAARERVALLRSARERELFWALLRHMERGWQIITPLQVAADQIAYRPARHPSVAQDVATFIECDPTDTYRGIAHTCMHAVPGAQQCPRQPGLAIVMDEARDVARYLRVLALGTDHPAFPPELRALVGAAAVEMTEWQAGLAGVLEPVEDCIHPT